MILSPPLWVYDRQGVVASAQNVSSEAITYYLEAGAI
jgi:hypothetical protein